VRNLQSIFLLDADMENTYSLFVKGMAKRSGVQECEEYEIPHFVRNDKRRKGKVKSKKV